MGVRLLISLVPLTHVVLAGTLLSGCSTGSDPGSSASATVPPSNPAQGSPLPWPSPTFRSREIQDVPDPRTMLSARLRGDLRFAAFKNSTCRKHGAGQFTDRWSCHLVTPAPDRFDRDLTEIFLDLHRPTLTKDATTAATEGFAFTKQNFMNAASWPTASFGDEAVRTPDDGPSRKGSHVLFRLQNVRVQILTSIGDQDSSVATLFAEQRARATRVASDLIRSLERLRR